MTTDRRGTLTTCAALTLLCAAGAPASAQTLETTGAQDVTVGAGETIDLAIARDASVIRLEGGEFIGESDLDIDGDSTVEAFGVSAVITDDASLLIGSGAVTFNIYTFGAGTLAVNGGTVGRDVVGYGQSSIFVTGGAINTGPFNAGLVARESSSIVMSGGEADVVFGFDTGAITLEGGLMHGRIELWDDSSMLITGGDVGGLVSTYIRASDTSSVHLVDGRVRGWIGGHRIEIDGGEVTGDVTSGNLSLRGGLVGGDVIAGSNSVLSGGQIDGRLIARGTGSPTIRAMSFFHDHDNDPATPPQAIDTYAGFKNLPYSSSIFSTVAGDPYLHSLSVVWENGERETFDFVGEEIDEYGIEWTGQLRLELVGCVTDLSGDGFTDGADLGLMLGQWGQPGATDFNADGVTDGADLGFLLGAWGVCGSN